LWSRSGSISGGGGGEVSSESGGSTGSARRPKQQFANLLAFLMIEAVKRRWLCDP
jgi:hypothetical protein